MLGDHAWPSTHFVHATHKGPRWESLLMRKHCAGPVPAWPPCSSLGWASGPGPGLQVYPEVLGYPLTPSSQTSWDPKCQQARAGTSLLCQRVRPDPRWRGRSSPPGGPGTHPRPGSQASTSTQGGDKSAEVSPGPVRYYTKQQNSSQAAANLENSRDSKYPAGGAGWGWGGAEGGPQATVGVL